MNLLEIQQQIRKQSKAYGRNLVLENAERQREYFRFRKALEIGINKQGLEVARDQKLIDDLLIFIKAEVNNNMKLFLSTQWKSLSEFVENVVFDKFYEWSGNIGGRAALDKMGIKATPFYLENEEVNNYFKDRRNLLIQSIDETGKKRILGIIQRGRLEMLTPYEISKKIKSEMSDISQVRADMIARNELANAINTVEYETFRRNRVQKVRWVTVLDDRVCPFCEPLHNTEIAINNKFSASHTSEGNKTTTYSVNYPPLHVNCRCYLEEVIEGFEVRNEAVVWAGQ